MFANATLPDLLDIVEPLLASTDKFQQAAAAEILTGLLRGMLYGTHICSYSRAIGSKHWSQHSLDSLWGWFVPRFDQILSQARPDTVVYWTSFLQVSVLHCCSFHALSCSMRRRYWKIAILAETSLWWIGFCLFT